MKLENKEFNYKEFKDIIASNDNEGIQYLYDNEIKYYNMFIDRHAYIYNLYVATMSLNIANNYYETRNFENDFNFDLYMEVRNKLLEELGFNVEKLYK